MSKRFLIAGRAFEFKPTAIGFRLRQSAEILSECRFDRADQAEPQCRLIDSGAGKHKFPYALAGNNVADKDDRVQGCGRRGGA